MNFNTPDFSDRKSAKTMHHQIPIVRNSLASAAVGVGGPAGSGNNASRGAMQRLRDRC